MVNSDTVLTLSTMREKNGCAAANKYLGEFWYDIARGAGLILGVCPILEVIKKMEVYIFYCTFIFNVLGKIPYASCKVKF